MSGSGDRLRRVRTGRILGRRGRSRGLRVGRPVFVSTDAMSMPIGVIGFLSSEVRVE